MSPNNATHDLHGATTPDITPRLQTGLEMFIPCDTGADIGSDHGKMAVALLQTGVCENVIATDISAPSLAKARKAARVFQLENHMELRVGNGLLCLDKGEAQSAVIAGMGGEMIARILQDGDGIARAMEGLVLQPMQHAAKLRFYLRSHEWRIEDEQICNEGRRIYEWIRIAPGSPDNYPSGFDTLDEGMNVIDEIGPLLFSRRDPLAIERLKFKQKTWQREYELARRGMADSSGRTAGSLKQRVLEADAVLRVLESK